jgi:hypothetical protein
MKRRKRKMLFLVSLILVLAGGTVLGIGMLRTSSVVSLSANPQGDATACIQHPSKTTCSQQVSPFGTEKPGAASCAAHATIPTLVDLSDPMVVEVPIATLQVWQSPTCHASFASAYTSTMLQRKYTLTVSIAQQSGWWHREVRTTTLQSSGKPYEALHAWTALLPSDHLTSEMVEACVTVVAGNPYHVCASVPFTNLDAREQAE